MKFDVICFGSGLVDIFAYTNSREIHGEVCYPLGSKIEIEEIQTSVGGGGINASTTFSRMGLKTALLNRLGKDDFSKAILHKIRSEGVVFLGKCDGETGYSIILDSKEHDRTLLTYKGSNNDISFDKIKNIFLKNKTSLVYFSSLTGISYKTQIKVAKMLRRSGVKIAFNPSMYLIKKEDVNALIKLSDILVLNKEEADAINRDNMKILSLGPKILCVTDAKKPFFCYTKSHKFKVFPHDNIKIAERTGAGDAFASSFVASLTKIPDDIEHAIQVGVANSESVIKFWGSTNKILSWSESLKAVSKNPCRIKVWRIN